MLATPLAPPPFLSPSPGSAPVHEDYRLEAADPSVEDYVRLRAEAGLSPKTPAQAAAALSGAWHTVRAVHAPSGATVGMGRIIGDGGWYFHIVDMAVLPAHQRRGIGDAILTALLATIRRAAPDTPYITLLADPPGRPLYRRHGFVETAPRTVGMYLPRR